MHAPRFAFSHRTNNFATHQPFLYAAVRFSTGPPTLLGRNHFDCDIDIDFNRF